MGRNIYELGMSFYISTIITAMMVEWHLDVDRLSYLLNKNDLVNYMLVCHDEYNSMGILGVLDDLKRYIEECESL